MTFNLCIRIFNLCRRIFRGSILIRIANRPVLDVNRFDGGCRQLVHGQVRTKSGLIDVSHGTSINAGFHDDFSLRAARKLVHGKNLDVSDADCGGLRKHVPPLELAVKDLFLACRPNDLDLECCSDLGSESEGGRQGIRRGLPPTIRLDIGGLGCIGYALLFILNEPGCGVGAEHDVVVPSVRHVEGDGATIRTEQCRALLLEVLHEANRQTLNRLLIVVDW
mmetsp:Transcript_52918/g.107912  ORF Transcript_52918/g.107912 Transcript_52918/m.107912 type:complete len:222 (+) Transcript_52918:153-818(+)